MKSDKHASIDSRLILVLSNKGSLKGSNSEPSNFFFAVPTQGAIIQPDPTLQPLVDSETGSDDTLKNNQKHEFIKLVV